VKPEALRLADLIQSRFGNDINDEAAAELRRLHEVNQELLEALKYYADIYCEGWCGGHVANIEDCGGCRARAAIAKAEGKK
jgi:hypothetical protein